MLSSLSVLWFVLWFHNLQIAGLNPFGDTQGYELFREIPVKSQ